MQSGLPCIALGPFVRALAQKSYEDFGIIKDQLQDIPRANRDKLLEFLPSARHKLIRFLVLIRYLKQNHSRIKALEKIHENIIKSEHQYVTVCRNFDALYTEMVTSFEAQWDIESALHVLTLGSYRNLPQIIDKTIQTIHQSTRNNRLSPTFVSSTIHKLNNALRVRLLSDRIPPELKLLNINKGMVFMIARNQFEIAISLRMRPKLLNDDIVDENERVRWSLFELKLLLKAGNECIVNDIERNVLLLTVNNKMKSSKYPLQTMYKELNTFCGKLQFAVFNQQIQSIRYKYNDKNIKIEREKDKFITIRMWKNAAILPNDCYNISDIYRNKGYNDEDEGDAQLQSKTNYSKKSKSILGSSYFNTNANTNLNMESLDEFERKENAIKTQFRISLSILYEEQCLDIKYHPRLPSFVTDDDDDTQEDDDYKHLLCIDSSDLNLSKLIENFTILHCNYRLLYLLNKLIEVDKEYRIAPKIKAIDCENRKYVLFSNDKKTECNLKQKHKLKIMKNLDKKYIEICLCDTKCVEIYVDTNNGRIVFEKSYHEFVSTAPLIFEKNLKVYNEDINDDLSKISCIIRNLKIDVLLENVIDIVENELNLDIVSYSVCNKPNKYIVYPSLLMHNHSNVLQLNKGGKNVRIKECHIMQTYTEILNSWNEDNSVFIAIPGFGKHCHLVIFYRSQTNVETYCIATDHFGNLLYIHNIILNEKPQYDRDNGVIAISSELIKKYIEYCLRILPEHLIRIMISLHLQISITDLNWNMNKGEIKSIKFPLILPRAASTSNLMHIIPRTFEFEVILEESEGKDTHDFEWKCIVKQDTIFTKHKESLVLKLNKMFKYSSTDNALVFSSKNNVNIGNFSRICGYCYKLLIVHNLLKGFIDHKQAIKQSCAFYESSFYRLKGIDLVDSTTIIEIEFTLFDAKKCVLNLEIVWNHIDHVEYYIDSRFNPYIHNTDYSLNVSFSDANIFKYIPNLKRLITHYFNFRRKYHKKLNILLRKQYVENENFSFYDAMLSFKDLIGSYVTRATGNKCRTQSFVFVQYESLSFQMFLQKLYWSIKTLHYLNPFISCINTMHTWFYPQLDESFISLDVTRYDTLRIISSFASSNCDNILSLRFLSENKVCLHSMDAYNGWQLTLNEIPFIDLSNNLLSQIAHDLLLPQKRQLFCKIFNKNKVIETRNDFLEITTQNVMFSSLKSSPLFDRVLLLLNYDNISKLRLNQNQSETDGATKAVTLYSFEALLQKYIKEHDAGIDGYFNPIQFIDDVMKAYFYLYCDDNEGYSLYHQLKVQSFLSVLFSSFMHFVSENNSTRVDVSLAQHVKIQRIAKSLLSICELFALYYDEMLQLSIFGGCIDGIVGANYFKNINTKLNKIKLNKNQLFWYNLNHINDSDIIYDENAVCVEIHFAQINFDHKPKSKSLHFYKSTSKSSSVSSSASASSSPSSASKRGRGRGRRRRKRGGKYNRNRNKNGKNEQNGYHHDNMWMFEKYELNNHLFLNIAVCLNEESNYGQIFFYQNYKRKYNKYRKISIAFLPDLHKIIQEINAELKTNAYLGTLIVSFLREFVNKLSHIKRNDEHTFQRIWKQLTKLNH